MFRSLIKVSDDWPKLGKGWEGWEGLGRVGKGWERVGKGWEGLGRVGKGWERVGKTLEKGWESLRNFSKFPRVVNIQAN